MFYQYQGSETILKQTARHRSAVSNLSFIYGTLGVYFWVRVYFIVCATIMYHIRRIYLSLRLYTDIFIMSLWIHPPSTLGGSVKSFPQLVLPSSNLLSGYCLRTYDVNGNVVCFVKRKYSSLIKFRGFSKDGIVWQDSSKRPERTGKSHLPIL